MEAIFIIKKAWTWLKEHWQVPAILLYTVVMAVFFRRNTAALKETLEIKKESYDRQIQTLRSLHKEEILKRDGLIERYQDIVAQLEEDFRKNNKILEKEHKEEIKRVVIESKKSPEETKKRIQNMFGFEYVE